MEKMGAPLPLGAAAPASGRRTAAASTSAAGRSARSRSIVSVAMPCPPSTDYRVLVTA
jgi:hypothetical protein